MISGTLNWKYNNIWKKRKKGHKLML